METFIRQLLEEPSGKTLQTHIRLLIKEQSDQGLSDEGLQSEPIKEDNTP